MSLVDLWSDAAMVPKPIVTVRQVSVVPRDRIYPEAPPPKKRSRPTSIENLAAARDREIARLTTQAWEEGFRIGRMVGEIDLEYVEENTPGVARMVEICREVAKKHGMPVAYIIGDARTRDVVVARHEAIWRCAMETGYTMARIGRHFGGKDHTTIMNAIRRHEERRLAEE